MAQTIDYLLDSSNDLVFNNGDLTRTSGSISDQQSAAKIINISQGSLKLHPYVGLGIWYYLGSTGLEKVLQRNMTVQLDADGFKSTVVIPQNNPSGYMVSLDRPGYE